MIEKLQLLKQKIHELEQQMDALIKDYQNNCSHEDDGQIWRKGWDNKQEVWFMCKKCHEFFKKG